MFGMNKEKNDFRPQSRLRAKKQNNKKKILVMILAGILVMAVVVVSCGYIYLHGLLDNASQVVVEEEELAPNTTAFEGVDVINIALFGIDSRADSSEGRSDAIMILTVDKKHNKIKLSSIARDSYVNIDGYGKDKLTHAYVFGGAPLAIRTINQNFNMDITDYVTVNFFGMVDIIDELGGVDIDVSSAEMGVMNKYYIPELNKIGIPCEYVTQTGMQRLTGAQALAYSRNRYVGGDVERGNRQKEILNALFGEISKVSVAKYPAIIKMALTHCETSLSNNEILSLAVDAVTNMSAMENFSLPTDNCNPKEGANAFINGVWYYIYDLDTAVEELHSFITENE